MHTFDPDTELNQHLAWYFTTGLPSACPGDEVLADYVQGRLRDHACEAVEEHLALCSRCSRTVCTAAEVLQEQDVVQSSPVPAAVLEQLYDHIPRPQPPALVHAFTRLLRQFGLVRRRFDGLISFRQPALVYVRGRKKAISKNLIVLEKTFSSIKLLVEVEKTGPHRADIKVIVTKPRTGARCHGVRIDLCAGKKELASFVAVRGEALFENIVFGTYRLIARDDRSVLGDVRLSIKE